jgi:death-on-curing protein
VTQYIEEAWLLRLAETIDGDPQADDLGALVATVARHRAVMMDREVYGSVWLKAAALMHSLVRTPALEHSNGQLAFLAAVGFLELNEHHVAYSGKDAVALVADVAADRIGVQQIALQLRRWQA